MQQTELWFGSVNLMNENIPNITLFRNIVYKTGNGLHYQVFHP